MSNLYVYLMRSRNKDNKDIPNFKGRVETILEYKENENKIIEKFRDFVARGVPGEQTRLYRSVNSRNEEKIREELIIRLLKDKPSMTQLNRTLASVALQVQNRDESKWLFDFDVDDDKLALGFIGDITNYGFVFNQIEMYKTPHGYAIIVPHGFDTRELMEKWKDYDITLKKDELLFLNMITNGEVILREYIEESNNIVFFGGAGVSTESGIPDFRSKDGLYNQHDVQFDRYEPEYLLSKQCLYNNPKVFYEFYRQKMDTRNIKPNITHKVLAKMEEIGKLSAIVTQNIDGLHQKAGSKNVFEIHGTTQRNYCSKCKMEYHSDFLFDTKETIPKCECGGLIRPDVTLYGEKLPNEAVNGAIEAISNADMLIIGGTSLQVYPAAKYISYFKGNHLVVINREKIQMLMNENTDLMIVDLLGNVFSEIEKWM